MLLYRKRQTHMKYKHRELYNIGPCMYIAWAGHTFSKNMIFFFTRSPNQSCFEPKVYRQPNSVLLHPSPYHVTQTFCFCVRAKVPYFPPMKVYICEIFVQNGVSE